MKRSVHGSLLPSARSQVPAHAGELDCLVAPLGQSKEELYLLSLAQNAHGLQTKLRL